MEEWIRSGRIADIMLVVLAIETAVVGYYLWSRGQGLALMSFTASSLAGGSLVLAFRSVIRESGWLFVAIYLGAALLAHVADLVLRLLVARQAGGPPPKDP